MGITTFWQKKGTYKLMTKGHQLELEISAEKHPISKFFVLGQMILFAACLLLIPFIIVSQWSWITLLMGLSIFGLFTYIVWSSYWWLHWEKQGKEVLKIDLRQQQLLYFKMGLYPIDVRSSPLDAFTGFRWCPENDDYGDDEAWAGLEGGRLCFWLGDRRYRFAIALDKEDAKRCLKALNTFLKSPKP